MPEHSRLAGLVVPMVTPITSAGTLDEQSTRRVVNWLTDAGVDGIFVIGTTGEAASLAQDQRAQLVALTLKEVDGRCRVYAGIGGNCVAESLAAGRKYLARGVDAVVACPPAFFALNDVELIVYYRQLADGLGGPLVLYNMPLTTHISISISAMRVLADHPLVIGAKDSENDPDRLGSVIAAFRDRPDFAVLIGPSALAVQTLRRGADGVVPSSGNLVPHLWRDLVAHARAGRWSEALALQARVDAVARVYQNRRSLGQSMAALKAAMAARSLCGPDTLPPLLTSDEAERTRLREELVALGLG